jgi:hypothetical protein
VFHTSGSGGSTGEHWKNESFEILTKLWTGKLYSFNVDDFREEELLCLIQGKRKLLTLQILKSFIIRSDYYF